MRASNKIVVIGNACMDMFMSGVLEWPGPGERAMNPSFPVYFPGGNGLNVAVNLAKCEWHNTLLTAIGTGRGGHSKRILDYVAESDRVFLDSSLCCISRKAPARTIIGTGNKTDQVQYATGVSLIKLDAKDEPSFVYFAGVTKFLDAKLIRAAREKHFFRECGFLHLCGLGTCESLHTSAVGRELRAIRKARGANPLEISLDINLRNDDDAAEQWDAVRQHILPEVDVFMPNEDELRQFMGNGNGRRRRGDVRNLAAELMREFPRLTVVVKQDKDGALLFERNKAEPTVIMPFRSDRVVDLTGAGDAWCAGFIFGRAEGYEIEKACRFGNLVAKLCIAELGCTNWTATRDDLKFRFNIDPEGDRDPLR